MNEHRIPITTYAGLEKELNEFLTRYELIAFMPALEGIKTPLKTGNERICRYCGKRMPEITFKKDAHIVAQLFGKNDLLCDYECDVCNDKFSGYESSMSNWIGITRTLLGTKNRKDRVPRFLSAKGEVNAFEEQILNIKGTKVGRKDVNNPAMKLDAEAGKVRFSFTKRPYVPYNVYRLLLKIAGCSLPAEEVLNYQNVNRQLVAEQPHPQLQQIAQIMTTVLPFGHQANFPYGLLFQKKNPDEAIPRHHFVFNFGNHVYNYPIPFHVEDAKKGIYRDLTIFWAPPILLGTKTAEGHVAAHNIPLNSFDSVKDQKEEFGFDFDPEMMKNLVAFDPSTGKKQATQLDPSTIIGLFISDADTTMKLPLQDT